VAGFTHHDEIAQRMKPAVRRLRNDRVVRREQRVDQAIDESGVLKAAAVIGLPLVIIRGTTKDTNASTSDTVNWTDYLRYPITLPDVTSLWGALIEAEFRAGSSDGTSIDAQLLVNSTILDTLTRTAPTSSAAPIFLQGEVFGAKALSGGDDHELLVRFKSDSGGTITVNNCRLRFLATREK
jgi:hypothetical protein